MCRLVEFESSPSSNLLVITHHRPGCFVGLDRRDDRTVFDCKQATRAETFEDSTGETQDEDRCPRVESAVVQARKTGHAARKNADVDRSNGGAG